MVKSTSIALMSLLFHSAMMHTMMPPQKVIPHLHLLKKSNFSQIKSVASSLKNTYKFNSISQKTLFNRAPGFHFHTKKLSGKKLMAWPQLESLPSKKHGVKMNYKNIVLGLNLIAASTIALQKESEKPEQFSYLASIPVDIRTICIKYWFGLADISKTDYGSRLKVKRKLFELIQCGKDQELGPFLYFFCSLSDMIALHMPNPESCNRTPLEESLFCRRYRDTSACTKILLSFPGVYPTANEHYNAYILYETCRIPALLPDVLARNNRDINAKHLGITALHAAVGAFEPQCVDILLKQPGIDINVKSDVCQTPLDLSNQLSDHATKRVEKKAQAEIKKLLMDFKKP